MSTCLNAPRSRAFELGQTLANLVQLSGIAAQHVSSHAETTAGDGSTTESTVAVLRYGPRVLKVNLISVSIPVEGDFFTACIIDACAPSITLYATGFANGQDLSLDEILKSLAKEITALYSTK